MKKLFIAICFLVASCSSNSQTQTNPSSKTMQKNEPCDCCPNCRYSSGNNNPG
ncbi:MAG TPA: hypothetical protein VLE89_04665 [Chlamydiales bacterium]|nr:hypothetical protein [Chlamydiales bacterium]